MYQKKKQEERKLYWDNLTEEERNKIRLEYSPESFSTTEIDYALEVCEAVKKEWGASKENYHRVDETQLVYTITSRAMYKLDIIYTGEKSPLLDADKSTYEEK